MESGINRKSATTRPIDDDDDNDDDDNVGVCRSRLQLCSILSSTVNVLQFNYDNDNGHDMRCDKYLLICLLTKMIRDWLVPKVS